uniref:ULP_PROTEASE domain-containing protein n=1 Tax=Steinernema glaseri TaxID=37863 RepID=A0A1I7YMJ2_9BILA
MFGVTILENTHFTNSVTRDDFLEFIKEESFYELNIHEEDVQQLYKEDGVYGAVLFHMLHHNIPEAVVVHPMCFKEWLLDSELYLAKYNPECSLEWVIFPVGIFRQQGPHMTLAVANMKTGVVDYYDSERHFYREQKLPPNMEAKLLQAAVTFRDNLPLQFKPTEQKLPPNMESKLLQAAMTFRDNLPLDFKPMWTQATLRYVDPETYAKQYDDHNCGVYSCLYAERIVKGGDIRRITYEDIEDWRMNAAKRAVAFPKRGSSFPKNQVIFSRHQVTLYQSVEVLSLLGELGHCLLKCLLCVLKVGSIAL